MIPSTIRIIGIILDECDWILRYPRIPEITEDSSLEWMGPIDRICVQMALDETFGVELPSAKFNATDTVAAIKRLIEAHNPKAIEAGTAKTGTGLVHESAVPQGIRHETQGLIP